MQPRSDVIDYNMFTMASTGDAQDFGNLIQQIMVCIIRLFSNSWSCWWWWISSPAQLNVIQYIQIPTLGDAQDFGDLTAARSLLMQGGFSNGLLEVYSGTFSRLQHQ